MQSHKKPLSIGGRLSCTSGDPYDNDEIGPDASNTRSSLDSFLIPGRTRYPSDETDASVPTAIDLHIAATLLKQSNSEEGFRSDSEQQTFSSEPSAPFVSQYNTIAKRYGLSILDASQNDDKVPKNAANNENVKHNAWSWFQQRLSRKTSLIHVPARRLQTSPDHSSLDDICRVGGLSCLDLSRNYSCSSLAVPTCIAATAKYLIQHGMICVALLLDIKAHFAKGRGASGIFRIPGQTGNVNALYEYYVSRIRCEDEVADKVQATIARADLPQDHISNVHDVASAFKKFLWDIPGGIVGSIQLFKTFQEIESLPQPHLHANSMDEQLLKSRLIALALLSLHSVRRFHLILAVFGLLAFLKHDKDWNTSRSKASQDWTQEHMSSKALGVVFAPVLLGNLTEGIELDGLSSTSSKKGLLQHRKTSKRDVKTECSPEIKASIDRTNSAANIIEFLLRNWRDIIQQLEYLKGSTTSSISRLCSLPKSASQPILGLYTHSLPVLARRAPSCTGSMLVKSGMTNASSITSSHHCSEPLHGADSNDSRNVSESVSFSGAEEQQAPLLRSAGPFGHARISGTSEGNLAWWEECRKSGSNTSVIVTKRSSAALSDGAKIRFCAPNTCTSTASEQSNCALAHIETVSGDAADVDPFLDDNEELCDKVNYRLEKDEPLQRDYGGLGPAVVNHQPQTLYEDDQKFGAESRRDSLVTNEEDFKGHRVTNHETECSNSTGLRSSSSSSGPMQQRQLSPNPGEAGRHMERCCSRDRVCGDPEDTTEESIGLNTPATTFGAVQSSDSTRPSSINSMTATPTNGTPQYKVKVAQSPLRSRRLIAPLPLMPDGTIARRVSFRRSSEDRHEESSEDIEDITRMDLSKAKVGTLFAEIRRHKLELDMRREENKQLRQELDAMRRFKDAGTLSEKLREAERELRFWKYRAERAEKSLFGRGGSDMS